MILEYNTILGETESTTVIEHSKFICNLKRIENEDDAKEFISVIRKRHSLANHHCYAYIADENGLNMKFSDDGEPQGTAGMPMLDVLKSKKVYKTHRHTLSLSPLHVRHYACRICPCSNRY